MYINIRELLSKGGRTTIEKELDVSRLFENNSDVTRVEPIHIDVQAKSDSGVVDVSGTLTLSAEFSCSRCLCPYGQTIAIPFHERFTRDKADDDEDEELHQVTDDLIDLTPYVEESLLLGLPYIPVCHTECKGLNPETGTNLNIDPADVPKARIDPRLAVLQQWFDNNK